MCRTVFPSTYCYAFAASETQPAYVSCSACAEGRRPEGFSMPALRGDPLQVYLSAASALEAASISAFDHLARELFAHNAPEALVSRALSAKEDERRHAREMTRLARARGLSPRLPKLTFPGVRALEVMALENAVEGCARETWGAMLAWWQATHAQDPDIAKVFKTVAEEETAHAELAWDVNLWLEGVLDEASKKRCREARDAAVRELREQMDTALPEVLITAAGLPGRDASVTLWQGLSDTLWRN